MPFSMSFSLPLPVPGAPDLLLLLLAALTFDALFGDLAVVERVLGLPRRTVLAAAGWCDRRLNRLNRSAGTRVARGFIVTAAPNGEDGLDLAAKLDVDLVLLDLILPGKGGLLDFQIHLCEPLTRVECI